MTQMTATGEGGALGTNHPLVARITRLRGRVRVVVGLVGAGVVVIGAVGGMFLLMLLDYLVHIPAGLRMTLLIAWVVGLGLVVWRYLFMPLTTRLTDQFLASRVENVNKDLADELISALHFIHLRAGATNVLAARHIDAAAQKAASVRFEDAVDFRPAGKSVGIALLVMAVVGVIAALNPMLTRVALSRWLSASPMAWPRVTHVDFDWSMYGGAPPKKIPLNEKFTVRAKVDQGGAPRVWLYYWTDKDRRTVSQLMTIQKEQSNGHEYIFETAIEPDGKELSMRVVAGDDYEEKTVTIGMAGRPSVTDLQGSIAAPAYVQDSKDAGKPAPAVTVNLLSQAGRAVQGAMVSVRATGSKDFGLNAKGEPEVRFLDQNKDSEITFAMTRRLLQPNVAELTFSADKTLQARVMMRDVDGFENRVGVTATIEVVPDALPSIVITDPRRSVERAPMGIVEITIQSTDDWGFTGLKLRAEKFDAKENDPPAFETDLKWTELAVDTAVGNTNGKAKFTWDLTSLNLQPGARLTFYAMVQDNYQVNGERHPWVKSAPLSLIIKSANDIADADRKALNEIADRIKSLRNQQDTTRAQTDAVRRIIANSGEMTGAQRTQLAGLALQENQEAASANSIQQRADQVAEDLRQNKMGEGELGKMAQEVSAGMGQVGQQNMPRAAGELNNAQQAGGRNNQTPEAAKQAAQSMGNASGQQGEAITKMDDLLAKLGTLGDFETFRNEVANILNAQTDLNKQTQSIAPAALGRKRDELPKDIQAKEDKLAEQQKELKNRTAEVLDRMSRAIPSLSQSDNASAQSLQKASQAATDSNVTGAQGSASDQLSQNQMQQAGSSQSQAQAGLQQMMDELNKNEMRKLEQLAREIRQLLEDVKRLKMDEEGISKDTVAAGADAVKAAMQKLGNRQGTLQLNTIIVQKKAEGNQRTRPAAADIYEASENMVTAATALNSVKQPAALEPETKAIAALDEAIKKLTEAANQAQNQLKQKELAEFIKQYEAIKKDESTLKETTDQIEKRRQAAIDKQIDRADGLKVAALGTTQGGLIDQVNLMSKEDRLKEFEVVVWMNGQVTEAMGDSKERLERAQLGPKIASAQQTSIDRLDMIINALKEEQARDAEFENEPQGGGGGGGGGQPPLIPPITQLKMLKEMQRVVNGQTKDVNDNMKVAGTPADKNELETQAQKLGLKQGDIKTIADNLMKQLQGGGGGGGARGGNRGGGPGGPDGQPGGAGGEGGRGGADQPGRGGAGGGRGGAPGQ